MTKHACKMCGHSREDHPLQIDAQGVRKHLRCIKCTCQIYDRGKKTKIPQIIKPRTAPNIKVVRVGRKWVRKRANRTFSFYCPRCKKGISASPLEDKKLTKVWKESEKMRAHRNIFVENHYRHVHTDYEDELQHPNGRSILEIRAACNRVAIELMKRDGLVV